MAASGFDKAKCEAASKLLVSHWQAGTVLESLPSAFRPGDRAEGYAVQALVERTSHSGLRGWKIAATSTAGQKHIGVDGPLAGRLLGEMVFADGASLPFGNNRMRVAEPEFVFTMARDLAPRAEAYSQAEIMDAVADLHCGIEVPDSRFADFVTAGAPQLIADNACAHAYVLGPAAPDGWRDIDLAAHRVTGHVSSPDGRRYSRDGIGANVLGDPRIAMTWLVNELSRFGMTLRRGQFVTTGTCLVPLEIGPGDAVLADFGTLGRVSLQFQTT